MRYNDVMNARFLRHGIDLGSPLMRQFVARWKVRQLDVFGSVVRDDFGPESDVDFLVDFDETAEWDLNDLIDMRRELEHILGRPVDVITRYALECDCNPYFRSAVLGQAETIYAA